MTRNRRPLCLFGMVALEDLLSAAFVQGQTTPKPSAIPIASPTPSLEQQFFKNILSDQKAIWTAPFKLHGADAKWMVPAGVGTMALITTDRITGDKIAEFNRLEKPSRIVSYGGSTYGVAAVAVSFYFIGRKKKDDRARETGILSGEALIDSEIVVHALKAITQRARPQTGRERSEFFDGGNSFPSGHSTQAWAVAAVIANEYHDHPLVQVTAYGVASAVSISRFTGGRHYLSDILVGSALGYGIGKYVYKKHHRVAASSSDDDEQARESRWPAIRPQFNRGARQYGVALMWSF
ncbi:MAG TPA: phosphatase PAP2 family protein [Pyrinomonadaceae bacterium]|nr:phosphatase PAP2 family protein [Pyrinomonadaceae bacterium]